VKTAIVIQLKTPVYPGINQLDLESAIPYNPAPSKFKFITGDYL